jgi:hypothetical protein
MCLNERKNFFRKFLTRIKLNKQNILEIMTYFSDSLLLFYSRI